MLRVLTVVVLAFVTIGCTTTGPGVSGTTLVGAGARAVVGGPGTLVRAAIVGGTRAAVVATTAPPQCEASDSNGRPVAVAC